MLKTILDFIEKRHLNFYDIAIMTDDGIQAASCRPCNACNDSYSVTKLFISTAIGILVDKGLLSTEDRITKILGSYIPNKYDAKWDHVTIDHALTHRIGVDFGMIDIDRDDINTYGTNDFLDLIFSQSIPYEPGTYYCYTDTAYYLLSRVISKITNNPADELLAEKLLNPLGFRQAAWSRCPLGYTIGGTGLFASAADIVKLGWAYLNDGAYFGNVLFSKDWASKAVDREYSIIPVLFEDFVGKDGMNGQMLMFSSARRMAVAWHSYEPEGSDREIFQVL